MPDPRTAPVTTDDGVRLVADVAGNGPDVLLVPGLGYGAWSWFPQMGQLAADHRVIALDNRGAARSDKPDGPYSIDLLASDAAAVLEALAAGPATVVGASMGGYVAATLALQRPDLVRSLVLVATAVGGPGTSGVPEATAAAWAAASDMPPAEFARRTMPLALGPGWVERNRASFEDLLRRRLAHPTPAHSWRAQVAACERFLRDGLPPGDLDRPVVALHGTADRVVPAANLRQVARRFPEARTATIPGAGHLCWIEHPRLVTGAIRSAAASAAILEEPTC